MGKGKQKYNYTKRQSELFSFEKKGDNVEGILIDIQEKETKIGINKLYSVQVESGAIVKFFGTILINDNLSEADISKQILVSYTGANDNRLKVIDVFVVE